MRVHIFPQNMQFTPLKTQQNQKSFADVKYRICFEQVHQSWNSDMPPPFYRSNTDQRRLLFDSRNGLHLS
jgi:hypothetical protein